jgi:thiamine biosynthesis lipoprotein
VDQESHSNFSGDYSDIARGAIRAASELVTNVRQHVQKNAQIMGGHFSVTVVEADSSLADEVIDYLHGLEALWSRFLPTSEVSQLNNSPGVPVQVSPETLTLVQLLIDGFRLTNGLFDPTTLPLTLANGYSSSHVDPTRTTVLPESATWPGDIESIVINDVTHTVTLPLGTTLDPGGLGKGLAADLAVELAMSRGAHGALVSANGDVRASGVSPDGRSWRIGVEHPLEKHLEIAQVHISDGAVVTSSQMTNRWKTDAGDTHHIIDTKTGTSAKTEVLSATVVSAQAALGEVLAKLAFLLPIEDAVAMIAANGSQVCVVDAKMMMHTSAGWNEYLA